MDISFTLQAWHFSVAFALIGVFFFWKAGNGDMYEGVVYSFVALAFIVLALSFSAGSYMFSNSKEPPPCQNTVTKP